MSVDIKTCIKNLTTCRTGDHILFRSYGLNAIDEPGGLTLGDVKAQLAAFYPDARGLRIVQTTTPEAAALGGRSYTITLDGNNGGTRV